MEPPTPASPTLSEAERHAFMLVKHWIKIGRSKNARHKLSELVDDPHSWRPPWLHHTHYAHASGGTGAWWKLTILIRALAQQRGEIESLRTLLKHIEKPSPEVEVMSLKRGCGLAIDLTKLLAAQRIINPGLALAVERAAHRLDLVLVIGLLQSAWERGYRALVGRGVLRRGRTDDGRQVASAR